MNTETLRVLDSAHTYALRGIRGHALQRRDSGRSSAVWDNEKNNELKRTETNSGGLSSFGVRTSSLLIFIGGGHVI